MNATTSEVPGPTVPPSDKGGDVPERLCTSCGMALGRKGSVTFLCPQCGQASIGRCYRCRDQSVPYTCPSCGWVGP
jgi:predicted RNA-binding Zn-ribbon protein involved in translation (DUF1610 family)